MRSLKTLVFLDIDGTLLDPNYRSNSNAVPQLIKRLSKKGYVFSLNSNRSLRDLRPVAKKFGIEGPIIAENGVFVEENGKISFLKKTRKIDTILPPILKKMAQKKNVRMEYVDTVRYGKEKRSGLEKSWLVNKFREYTASIHVRSYGVRDLKAAQALGKELRAQLPKSYSVSVSPVFANVLVFPKNVDKGTAISRLKKHAYPSSKIIMIGDDKADLPTLKVVNAFYAVGNADKEIKKCATLVAQKAYTQGVVEILRSIDKI